MKQKNFKFDEVSRFNQREKRRKTNIILNSLIVLVILLIIIISVSIFFGNEDKASTANDSKKTESVTNNEEQTTESNTNTKDNSDENSKVEDESNEETANTQTETGVVDDQVASNEDEKNSEDVVNDDGLDPNVKTTITNPDWNPVGTVQSGEHAPVYDKNSTDWQEMIQAISYGTGIEESNMTVWFLGSNGAENQSIATVSTKDQSETYRVSLEWVDGQGWKPSKVEELYENDRR